jgi:nucleotide-binding universal stress UspA family protein
MPMREDHVTPKLELIAIAIDFGAPSLDAARWVARTFAPDAELILIHTLDVASAAPPGVRKPSADVVARARASAETRLREIAGELGERAIRIEVREDRPAPGIAAIAEATGADLIVVGPHGGRESIPGIGSTAERLIRMSSIPVLLVASPRTRALRNLLCPIDDVDLTPAVLHWADLFATRRGARVSIMHVLDARWRDVAGWESASTRPDVPGQSSYPTFGDYIGATEAWLATASRELTDNSRIEVITSVGIPGDEIRGTARRLDADLIVMGRRGRERVIPGVMGSTASMVLRDSPCPVLIVVDPPDAVFETWEAHEAGERRMP